MAKRVPEVTEELVEIEIVGSVKLDGEYVDVGSIVRLPVSEAERLVLSGHAKSQRSQDAKKSDPSGDSGE